MKVSEAALIRQFIGAAGYSGQAARFRTGALPGGGPHHDPHWQLWMTSAADKAPFERQGWEATLEAAQRRLIGAWSAFLAWAELPAIQRSQICA